MSAANPVTQTLPATDFGATLRQLVGALHQDPTGIAVFELLRRSRKLADMAEHYDPDLRIVLRDLHKRLRSGATVDPGDYGTRIAFAAARW